MPRKPNFQRAFADLMDLEGWGNAHQVEGDSGGLTVYGIARNYNPEMYEDGPPSEAEARQFYRETNWYPLRLDEMHSHAMAFEVLEFSVNSGDGSGYEHAVRIAQVATNEVQSLRWPGKPLLAVDGRIGPRTLADMNHVALRGYERPWVKFFNHYQLDYYMSLSDDLQRRFLLGWTRRV